MDAQTTIVEYVTGERSIYVFSISKNHSTVTAVPKDTLFEITIEKLRTAINKHDYDLYIRSAHNLYQTLIKPVSSHLKTKSLIIIPDNITAIIPFEALLTEEGFTKANGFAYSSLPYLLEKV